METFTKRYSKKRQKLSRDKIRNNRGKTNET